MVIGVLDDFEELGGIQITDLGNILSGNTTIELHDFSLIITLIAFVGVINSLNMLDGVDGLAGSIALSAIIPMSFYAYLNNDTSSFQILGLITISIITFLMFNWRFYVKDKALVFMGDSGSLFIGFVLAYFLIKLSQGEGYAMRPVTALWLFSFPVIETVTMLLRRLLKGRSPFVADREHFHHLLQKIGLNLHDRTKTIFFISIIFAGIGMFGEHYKIPEYIMFYLFLTLFSGYYAMIVRAWKVKRFFTKHLTDKQGKR